MKNLSHGLLKQQQKNHQLVKELYEYKQENQSLHRMNGTLEQALAKEQKHRAIDNRAHELCVKNLEQRINTLEKVTRELPVVLLTVWKLLDQDTKHTENNILFGCCPSDAVDIIRTKCKLTKEQAAKVWHLVQYFGGNLLGFFY